MSDEGPSTSRIERIVDERLVALAESDEFAGSSKRSFLALVAGGLAGYGASTVSGSGGSPAPVQEGNESDDGDGGASEEPETTPNVTVVRSAGELDSALDEGMGIRIEGTIDVSDITPVVIPENTIVYGQGAYRRPVDFIAGDGLRAESETPVVELAGNDSVLFGLGVVNTGPGDGISVTGFSNRVSHADVYAGRHGIDCSPDEETTEPRINFNRVISTTGSEDDGVGIRIGNMHDSKVINNIVAGFDIAIGMLQTSAIVSLNHTYTYPADSSSVGIRVTVPNVRVINNRIEGLQTEAGVDVRTARRVIVAHNFMQVGEGADGIAIEADGTLRETFVTENLLQAPDDAPAGTAVAGTDIDAFSQSVIGPNTSENFENEGLTAVSEAAGAGEAPSEDRYFTHQIVENRDDGSVWLKTGAGMVELG